MPDTDYFPVFTAMLRRALAGQLRDAPTYQAMLADDALVEFPYATTEPKSFRGRAAMHDHLEQAAALFRIDHAEALAVCHSDPPGTTAIEFRIRGARLGNGQPFDATNISVVETRDGCILRYREYFNPLQVSPPPQSPSGNALR